MSRVCDKERGEDNGRCIMAGDDKLLVNPVYSRLSLTDSVDKAIPDQDRKNLSDEL